MLKTRKFRKALLGLTAVLAGGTAFDNGCINTVASIPFCGTILTFCTPADQLNLFLPSLTIPDYETDPSCTIPLGCAGGDLYQNIPAGFPGGAAPVAPVNAQGGTAGGTAGGGGV